MHAKFSEKRREERKKRKRKERRGKERKRRGEVLIAELWLVPVPRVPSVSMLLWLRVPVCVNAVRSKIISNKDTTTRFTILS